MTILYFIVLGLIQGFTEFLPVSSSGHILIFSRFFGIEESLLVSIVLHVATLLSIMVVMRKEIFNLIKKPFSKEMRKLLISTLVTFIIVLLLYDIAKQSYLENYVSFAFMLTAVILILTEIYNKKEIKLKEFTYKNSVIMGVAQGLAIFPGLSRSGFTICAGIISGGEKEKVSKFSFLMSVPVILGSLVAEMIDISSANIVFHDFWGLMIGFIVAFVVGIFALKFMIKITKKTRLLPFALYLIGFSIVTMFI